MKKAILFTAILLLLIASIGAIRQANKSNLEVHLKKVELQNNEVELKKLESDFNKLNGANAESEQKVQELEKKRQQLEEEKKTLEAQLQAKAELKASQSKVYAAAAPTVPFTERVTGDKQSWLRASGIPESEWWAVDSIVSRESSWNPNAVNKSSGACGLGQQLPCGKWAGAWNDPVAALKAQHGYVVARYGGYPQAVAFWNANHWY